MDDQQNIQPHASGSTPPRDLMACLCDADGEILDLLLDARRKGAQSSPMPAGSAQRVACMQALLSLLDQVDHVTDIDTHSGGGSGGADHLIQRTVQYARDARQRDRFTEQVRMLSGPRLGMGFRWREAITAAAIVIIGVSLLLPALHQTHIQSIRQACLGNLGAAGQAIASYAQDHLGELPRRSSITPGTVWWNVGDPAHSNSAQLYQLVRAGYITADQLACPGNPYAPIGQMTRQDNDWPNERAISYSYQNQFTADPIRINQAPDLVVLADKNPLIIDRTGQMMLDMQLPREMASRSHGGQGQNVLEINGSVTWTVRPTTSRPDYPGEDNIWLMRGVTEYNGTEAPKGNDSFLVP